MLRLTLAAADLSAARFAVSPVGETIWALITLRDPSRHALHLPWYHWAAPRLDREQLDGLLSLLPAGRHASFPSFLVPSPDSPVRSLADELAEIEATPTDAVHASLRRVFAGRDLPEFAARLLDGRRTTATLRRLTAMIEGVHDAVIAPDWERITGVLEADILHRARQLATDGLAATMVGLHPSLSWTDIPDGTEIRIDDPPDLPLPDREVQLGPSGLVLVPSVFVWPWVSTKLRSTTFTSIRYPARGIGALWETVRATDSAPALDALVGPARGRVLRALRSPTTTGRLARLLDVSPSAVSQHLRVLRDSGLVSGERTGREVLHVLTPLGTALARST